MRIHITSVFVDDQARAKDFYTRILGFTESTTCPRARIAG